MNKHDKQLIALIVFNSIILSVICIIAGITYFMIHFTKLKTQSVNTMNLEVFRDSAPLPAKITGAKVLVAENKPNKVVHKKVQKVQKVQKPVRLKPEINLANSQKSDFLGTHTITFYSTEVCRPGKPCRTAIGTTPKHMYTAAVDPRYIPLGTKIFVEGFGILKAEDTGGAIKGNRIDIYIADHSQAIKLGRQKRDVYKVTEML